MVKTFRWVNTTVSSSTDPSLKWNTRRLLTSPSRATWRRSPEAMRTSLGVLSTRKPWREPSAKRTGTGPAAREWCHNPAVMRTSSPAVALPRSNILIRLLYRNREPLRDRRELDLHLSFLTIVSLFDDGAAQIRDVPPQCHLGKIVFVVVDPGEPRQ